MAGRALLEIAANSLDSALAAQAGGADRIELCAALEIGGLTPSHATIALARERVQAPIYVLIRPRAGDCVYSDVEFATMLRDVEACVAFGCAGVVIGVLDADGRVDVARCRALVDAAKHLGVTFHRAFDTSANLEAALEDVIGLGCERVLTSGAAPSALAGAARIRALVAQAGGRIRIMAGAGIDAGNIDAVRAASGAGEFHASAKRALPSRLRAPADPALGMHAGELRSDVEAVRALAAAVHGGTN